MFNIDKYYNQKFVKINEEIDEKKAMEIADTQQQMEDSGQYDEIMGNDQQQSNDGSDQQQPMDDGSQQQSMDNGSGGDPDAQQGDQQQPMDDGSQQQSMDNGSGGDPNAQGVEDNSDDQGQGDPNGGMGIQDNTNFANYNKLKYFKKFKQVLGVIDKTKNTMIESKFKFLSDENPDDRTQCELADFLIKSLSDMEWQIDFFIRKGILNVDIEKVRLILTSVMKKLTLIMDQYEQMINSLNDEEE